MHPIQSSWLTINMPELKRIKLMRVVLLTTNFIELDQDFVTPEEYSGTLKPHLLFMSGNQSKNHFTIFFGFNNNWSIVAKLLINFRSDLAVLGSAYRSLMSVGRSVHGKNSAGEQSKSIWAVKGIAALLAVVPRVKDNAGLMMGRPISVGWMSTHFPLVTFLYKYRHFYNHNPPSNQKSFCRICIESFRQETITCTATVEK